MCSHGANHTYVFEFHIPVCSTNRDKYFENVMGSNHRILSQFCNSFGYYFELKILSHVNRYNDIENWMNLKSTFCICRFRMVTVKCQLFTCCCLPPHSTTIKRVSAYRESGRERERRGGERDKERQRGSERERAKSVPSQSLGSYWTDFHKFRKMWIYCLRL